MKRHSTTQFGNGSFVGDLLRPEDTTLDLEPRDIARKLGSAAGCPVVERLTDPENTKPGRGSEAMIDRYGEVSFWYGELAGRLHSIKPELVSSLYEPTARKEGDKERMIAYDEQSIPDNHFELMQGLGTLYGYALPRIMIEEIRGRDDSAQDEVSVQDRMVAGIEAFESVCRDSDDMYELTAKFSEMIASLDGDNKSILGHILPPGWLEEHGATWMFSDMREAVREHAPVLWQEYIS